MSYTYLYVLKNIYAQTLTNSRRRSGNIPINVTRRSFATVMVSANLELHQARCTVHDRVNCGLSEGLSATLSCRANAVQVYFWNVTRPSPAFREGLDTGLGRVAYLVYVERGYVICVA